MQYGLLSRFSKKVFSQNGGFIRATELAPTLFVGKAKPVFMEIDKNLSSSQSNLLNHCLLYWIITGKLLDNSILNNIDKSNMADI